MLGDGIKVRQQVVDEGRGLIGLGHQGGGDRPLRAGAENQRLRKPMALQPVAAQPLGVGRSIGENQDLRPATQLRQGLDGARGWVDLTASCPEEIVEQLAPAAQLQVFGRSRPVDVLEERKTIDPKLEASRFQELAEALHEQAQDLVDIDDHQRPVPGQPKGF